MSRRRGSIVRSLLRAVGRRVSARKKARNAAEKRRKAAQAQILRQSVTTAGAVKEDGWAWIGEELPDSTKVRPVMGDFGWEYVPVRTSTKPRSGSNPAGAKVCGAKTKDGTPCKRRGRCPDHSKGK